jgi:hypothetical protein
VRRRWSRCRCRRWWRCDGCWRSLNRRRGCNRRGRSYNRRWRCRGCAGFRVVRQGRRLRQNWLVGHSRWRRRGRRRLVALRRGHYRRDWGLRSVRHPAGTADEHRRAGRSGEDIRVERAAGAQRTSVPRCRCAFDVVRACRRTRGIGWTVCAPIRKDWISANGSGIQDRRRIVQAIHADRESNQHRPCARSLCDGTHRPGPFPSPPHHHRADIDRPMPFSNHSFTLMREPMDYLGLSTDRYRKDWKRHLESRFRLGR